MTKKNVVKNTKTTSEAIICIKNNSKLYKSLKIPKLRTLNSELRTQFEYAGQFGFPLFPPFSHQFHLKPKNKSIPVVSHKPV